jgi:MtN3 and saliva related transmembrane protein
MDIKLTTGLAAGILTAVSMLPQLVKVFKEKKADQINISAFLILATGIALWVVYGFMIDDLPVILTNMFSFAVNMVMIFASFRYKDKG